MLMSVMGCPRIVKDAGGITKYPISSLESARRWLPASHEPCIQQLPVRRLATPDGDRRHRSQSGCVVHQVPILKWHQDVVSVLVLCKDGFDCEWRALGLTPIQSSLERGVCGDDRGQTLTRLLVEARVINERDITHGSDFGGRLTDRA